MIWIVEVHESKRPIVNRQPQNAHVICIEYTAMIMINTQTFLFIIYLFMIKVYLFIHGNKTTSSVGWKVLHHSAIYNFQC